MNPALFEIGVAAVMMTVVVALLVWFWRDLARASERRMAGMLARAGVASGREPMLQDARRRCRRCPSEGLCERWLAGRVGGDNSFCPNAQALRKLTDPA